MSDSNSANALFKWQEAQAKVGGSVMSHSPAKTPVEVFCGGDLALGVLQLFPLGDKGTRELGLLFYLYGLGAGGIWSLAVEYLGIRLQIGNSREAWVRACNHCSYVSVLQNRAEHDYFPSPTSSNSTSAVPALHKSCLRISRLHSHPRRHLLPADERP